MPFPLGAVIYWKAFRSTRIRSRPKPRYLIYFGKISLYGEYCIFGTTTSRVSFFENGSRQDARHYIFEDSHPCFRCRCAVSSLDFHVVEQDKVLEALEEERIIQKCSLTSKELEICGSILILEGDLPDRIKRELIIFWKDQNENRTLRNLGNRLHKFLGLP